MIRVFAGYDPNEAAGYHTFCHSVMTRASEPVSITPIIKNQFPEWQREGENNGATEFSFARFLVPYLCGYRGHAIFMDGADMLLKGDLAELEALRDPYKAVQVVKHDYQTNASRKYVGTSMEADNLDYRRKNWASVMLINCDHYSWRKMTPSVLLKGNMLEALSFSWVADQYIGELPIHWNWLVDEYGSSYDAKVLHWTQGVPLFKHYSHTPHSDEWFKVLKDVNYATE